MLSWKLFALAPAANVSVALQMDLGKGELSLAAH